MPEDVATVRPSELLAKLELEDLDLILRKSFASLDMWGFLVVQPEQHVIYRLTGRPKMAWEKLTEKDCHE